MPAHPTGLDMEQMALLEIIRKLLLDARKTRRFIDRALVPERLISVAISVLFFTIMMVIEFMFVLLFHPWTKPVSLENLWQTFSFLF